MDGTPLYNTTLASASKHLGKIVDCTNVSALDFDSNGMSSSFFLRGSKRKCSAAYRPINLKDDGAALVLGLGRLSSSCTTICSGKEMEEESSIDLGLGINLNRVDDRSSNQNNVSAVTLNPPNSMKHVLDLELSLSTGPAESDVTTVTQTFTPYLQHSSAQSLAPTIQLVDEGSTSSRWKTGPFIPSLQNVYFSAPFDQVCCNPTPKTPKISSTVVGTTNLVADSSGLVNQQQQQRRTSVKTCKFKGCTRGARGASGLCIAHGGGRRCQRAGCQKGAEGKTVFCKAHGGGKRCQHLGCTKSAEGRTDYCIGHGGGRRCSHEDCIRAARGKSGLCIRHGGGKRCKMVNCTKSAEGISGLCISHGGGRRCHYPECTKGAQGSTVFCKAHGGGRRCTYLGCTKGAEGSTPFCKGHGGGKRCTAEGCTKSVHGGTLFCVGHGGGKRCAVPECTKSARGRTNYCVRHGGGKRCKFEGCTKSAQGSTDFCKAHGGGKRCSWGQVGLEFGGGLVGQFPCDKFARGKSGLCASHGAQVQDKQVNESSEMVSTTQYSDSSLSLQMKGIFATGNNLSYATNDHGTTSVGSIGYGDQPVVSLPRENITAHLDHMALPEGRVHGGRLMAMLRGGVPSGASSNVQQDGGGQMEHGNSCRVPRSWI